MPIAQMNDALMTMRGDVTEASLAATADDLASTRGPILDAMGDPLVGADDLLPTATSPSGCRFPGTPTFVFGDQLVRGYRPRSMRCSRSWTRCART